MRGGWEKPVEGLCGLPSQGFCKGLGSASHPSEARDSLASRRWEPSQPQPPPAEDNAPGCWAQGLSPTVAEAGGWRVCVCAPRWRVGFEPL